MQRVVRSTLLGLLTIAGLTACGSSDVTPPVTGVVHQVTVSPQQLTIAVGQTGTLAASVDADASITDRTVKWTSSNTAVATVDGSTGTVTGVAAGTTTIIAAANADASVSGAAAVTVTAAGTGTGAIPTVTISAINQTNSNGLSAPVNADSVTGQIDVVLNVDAGTSVLKGVSASLTCGTDTLTNSQTIGDLAAAGSQADEAPITLSFNTAKFDSTGKVALHNGNCTISATATTAAGQQSAVNTRQLTLANTDKIVTSLATAPGTGQIASATGADGLAWHAGSVTVTALPVLYSGAKLSSMQVSLVNAGSNATSDYGRTALVAAGGVVAQQSDTAVAAPFTVTFPDTTTSPTGVSGVSVDTLGAIVSSITSAGATGPAVITANAKSNAIRLDNRAPTTTGIAVNFNTQNASNGFIGASFAFDTTAAHGPSVTGMGTTTGVGCTQTDPSCDYSGVDKVTFTEQYAVGSSKTFTAFTSASSIPESSSGSAYTLELKVCDALGNCATTASLGTFGVDLTAPTVSATVTTGPKDSSVVGIGQTLSTNTFTISATDPQSASGTTGSGFSSTPVLVTETKIALKAGSTTTQATTCALGTAGTSGCKAPVAEPLSFTVPTTEGQYQVTYYVVDQAGNKSPSTTVNYYIDQTAPSVSGGLTIPATVTSAATFSAAATDNMDLASANGYIHYPVAAGAAAQTRILLPGTLSTTGVAFDNTLNLSATATASLNGSSFFNSLASVNSGTISSRVKPDSVAVRATDAANNLSSTTAVAALPTANVIDTAAAYTNASLADFYVGSEQPNVSNGTDGKGTNPYSANLVANVIAASATAATPFTQVCFYLQAPSGTQGGLADAASGGAQNDLILIGCQTGASTTTVGGNRAFQYRISLDPSVKYGTSGTLNIVAIGSNAAGDALITANAGQITLTN